MTPTPWAFSRSTRASTSSVWRTPSAAAGSSSSTTCEPHSTARVMATCWRWPPESDETFVDSGGRDTPKRSKPSCTSRRMPRLFIRCRALAAEPGPELLAAQVDVLPDVQGGHQRQRLEDGLDAGGPGLGRVRELAPDAVHQELALVGPDVPREDVDERRLARAVVAHEADDLARVQPQADVAQGRHRAVALGRVRDLEQDRGAVGHGGPVRFVDGDLDGRRGRHAGSGPLGRVVDAYRQPFEPLVERVGARRQHQHDADRQVRVVRADVHQDEAVVEDADEEHAEEHAPERAAAAAEGHAAEQDGREHLQLEADADRHRGAVELGGKDHPLKAAIRPEKMYSRNGIRRTATPSERAALRSAPTDVMCRPAGMTYQM